MNTITKRLAQMTALYAAKKVWNQIDKEAAREMMGQMYRSAPSEWQAAARRAAGESFQSARSQATRGFDDALDQVGLMRRSQVPSRGASTVLLGVAGGVALTVAGGYFLYGTEAGKNLRQRMEDRFGRRDNEMATADHNMDGETLIQDPDAMDDTSAPADVKPSRRVKAN